MPFCATVQPEQVLQRGKKAYAETTAHIQSELLAVATADAR